MVLDVGGDESALMKEYKSGPNNIHKQQRSNEQQQKCTAWSRIYTNSYYLLAALVMFS